MSKIQIDGKLDDWNKYTENSAELLCNHEYTRINANKKHLTQRR